MKISWMGTASIIFLVPLFVGAGTAPSQGQPVEVRGKGPYTNPIAPGEKPEELRTLIERVLEPENPKVLGDFNKAINGLQKSGYLDRIDAFREEAVKVHAQNWRLLYSAANSYMTIPHRGMYGEDGLRRVLVPDKGRIMNAYERDRARALQLMANAMKLIQPGRSNDLNVARFYLSFAQMLEGYQGRREYWRLQFLTDFGTLPDYQEGIDYDYRFAIQRAPSTPDGKPLFYRLPAKFGEAKNDGERARWLYERALALDPTRPEDIRLRYAIFLNEQYGVHTLTDPGAHALETLGDDETVATLAQGVRRFDLPEEYNYIRMFQRIVKRSRGRTGSLAAERLAGIFENRRQYEKAARVLQDAGARFGGVSGVREKRIAQLLDEWGEFQETGTQLAGKNATVRYRYRNTRKVAFEVRPVKIETLLGEVKEYLRSNPLRIDLERIEIAEIGGRLVREGGEKYLGPVSDAWDLDLDPGTQHFDKMVQVATPLKEAGTYLLTAVTEKGHISSIVIHISDTVIVRKRLERKYFLYIADAETGRPIEGATVDFFGYSKLRSADPVAEGRTENFITTQFSKTTRESGLVIPAEAQFNNAYQWIITAKTAEGRYEYLGFPLEVVRVNIKLSRTYDMKKTFVVTDRPYYRPGQKVRFKLWYRHANFGMGAVSRYTNKELKVGAVDPEKKTIFEGKFVTDEYGGVEGEFGLQGDAAAGKYFLLVDNRKTLAFAVGEIGPPAFSVEVNPLSGDGGPGEGVRAVISARYRSGEPVADARVVYRIRRSDYVRPPYPEGPWDWLYGNGYAWNDYEQSWRPRWKLWGTDRPFLWRKGVEARPPETLVENEKRTNNEGNVTVWTGGGYAGGITEGDEYRYEIEAIVTDRDQHENIGRGYVFALRQPFMVDTRMTGEFYRQGDIARAEFYPRLPDGEPLQGKGIAVLYRMEVREGEPVETAERQWMVKTGPEGRAVLRFRVLKEGRYRLSCRFTDHQSRSAEGASVFTVEGPGFDSRSHRFNPLEIIPDKKFYVPGDTMRLMVNSDRPDSTVVLSLRSVKGVHRDIQVVTMNGKSWVKQIPLDTEDMPNLYIEAFTVRDGRVITEVREIAVPPGGRILNVDIRPPTDTYRPGDTVALKVVTTDLSGAPAAGTALISVYDASLEKTTIGFVPEDIRAFFWKWRRGYREKTATSHDRKFSDRTPSGQSGMARIGAFGDWYIDDLDGEMRLDSRGDRSGAEDKGSPFAWYRARVDVSGARRDTVNDAEAGVLWSSFAVADDGESEVDVLLPDHPGEWKVRVWVLDHGTRVGQGEIDLVTAADRGRD